MEGEEKVMDSRMRFTEEELTMLSNGILALIHNAGIAKTQVNKNSTKAIIDLEISELIALNNKICSEVEEVY